MSTTKTGFVISDLHLFSKRSSAEQYIEAIEDAMHQAQYFVLNGDIFDFKWSTHGSVQRSVAQAITWLEDKTVRFPDCQFHFVLGNHDSISAFTAEANALSRRSTNFHLHPIFVRIDDKLFVHGDVVHARGKEVLLTRYRARFEHRREPGRVRHVMYDYAVHLQLHSVVPRVLSKQRTAKNLLRYLATLAAEDLAATKHIYFGHTHMPFSDFAVDGWIFHNTGAMIHGLRNQILSFEVRQ